jgi:catalase
MAQRHDRRPVFCGVDAASLLRAVAGLGEQGPPRDENIRRRASRDRGVGTWAKSAPWTASYAEERFNSLDSFVFTDGFGAEHTVRWSLLPTAHPVAVSPDDLAKRGPNFLEQEITERVDGGPQRWTLVVTVANPGDPTDDPTKAWPADRRAVEVGTLTVQQIEAERDGPCRDINFDPTVLPSGMRTSDDPFPAARSSAYAKSYDRRTAEENDYPRTATGAKP